MSYQYLGFPLLPLLHKSELVAVDLPARVDRLSLSGAAPNPAAARTSINFSLSRSGKVSLLVFNTAGRLVETIASGNFSAGPHVLEWAPKVASGQYYLKLFTSEGSLSRTIQVLK
jgi:hypothetical protein